MGKFLFLLLLLPCGCQTLTWDGSLPPSGKGLSNDQRMEHYAKFAVTDIGSQSVVIRQGRDLVSYRAESYHPVLEKLSPRLAPELDHYSNKIALAATFAGLGSGLASMSLQRESRKLSPQEVTAFATGAVICALVSRYFGYEASTSRKNFMTEYGNKLDELLFPQ